MAELEALVDAWHVDSSALERGTAEATEAIRRMERTMASEMAMDNRETPVFCPGCGWTGRGKEAICPDDDIIRCRKCLVNVQYMMTRCANGAEAFRRVRRMHISPKVLAGLLSQDGSKAFSMSGMPKDATIVAAAMTRYGDLALCVESNSFPPLKLGEPVGYFAVTVKVHPGPFDAVGSASVGGVARWYDMPTGMAYSLIPAVTSEGG